MPPFHQTMVTSISDIMSKKIESIAASDNAQKAAKKMRDKNVSSLVVIDKGAESPLGILTERDVVKIVAYEIPPETTTAASLMVPSLVSISKNSSLEKAAKLMAQNRVRHLFVEDPANHEIIGIVTVTDLARYLKQVLSSSEAKLMLLEVLYPSEEEGEKQFWQ